MQTTLPIWITVVKNPKLFVKAGTLGAGVLTNLMAQSVEQLAQSITLYRET